MPIALPNMMLIDAKNSVTVKLGSSSIIKSLLKILPHFKCATI